MADKTLAQPAKTRVRARHKGQGMHVRHGCVLPAFALACACACAACGEESSSARERSESASPASSDERAPTNGAPADDAATSESDAGPPGPTGPLFSVQICAGASEISVPSNLPSCDGDFRCGSESHCFPTGAAREGPLANAPDCSAGKCLPDRVFAAQGRIVFRPCDGSGGAGVCIPQCLALMRNVLSAFFPRGEAGCGVEEVCVPCFNPLDGSPTGACNDLCAASS